MAENPMHDRFRRLCEIASPSGSEREVADFLLEDLRAAGADVREDDVADRISAGSGNLIARVPGGGGDDGPWLCFCAHIDTVPHDGPVEVLLEDGVYRSAGDTILGADNKAAVAVIAELCARAAASPGAVGIEALLTVREEDGLNGAKTVDLGALRSRTCFVLDEARDIGSVFTRAPTYLRLKAKFSGAEAHAGVRPEEGHSAIAAAAAAIDRMQIGRIDAETTANVGVIRGGTATNVIAGSCTIEAEARSLDPDRAAEVMGAMSDACAWGASEHGCDLDTRIEEEFRAYRLGPSSRALELAEAGLRRAGFEPERTSTGGGSDANALIHRGLDSVLLSNGTYDNHTASERVPARNLDAMLDVCQAIVAEAG